MAMNSKTLCLYCKAGLEPNTAQVIPVVYTEWLGRDFATIKREYLDHTFSAGWVMSHLVLDGSGPDLIGAYDENNNLIMKDGYYTDK